MFGQHVHDEITSNIFLTTGYHQGLSYIIAAAIGIIPLTKVPLNARPIYSTCEFFLGLDSASAPSSDRSKTTHRMLVVAVRATVTASFVAIALVVPGFDRVMAFMGSMACSLVCVVLPCSFHQKIFGKRLTLKQKILDWTLISIFSIGGLAGTICAFLPKHLLGAG